MSNFFLKLILHSYFPQEIFKLDKNVIKFSTHLTLQCIGHKGTFVFWLGRDRRHSQIAYESILEFDGNFNQCQFYSCDMFGHWALWLPDLRHLPSTYSMDPSAGPAATVGCTAVSMAPDICNNLYSCWVYWILAGCHHNDEFILLVAMDECINCKSCL